MEEPHIGGAVKRYRLEKGLRLRELAERAEISPSMLSQIENGLADPSIKILRKIAAALAVPIYRFFQEQLLPEDLIVRRGEYKTIGRMGETRYHLLTADSSGDLECCLMEIPAHGASSDEPQGHIGEEVAYVLAGEVEICLGESRYCMGEGDAVKIPPRFHHRWVNTGEGTARVLFAVTPPGF